MRSKTFENVFKDLKRHGAKACVICSIGGAPVAWFGTEKKSVELYSTLSAAIVSASRILHREFKSSVPHEIVSTAKDSLMIIREINEDSIFVVLTDEGDETLYKACEKAQKELRGVMR